VAPEKKKKKPKKTTVEEGTRVNIKNLKREFVDGSGNERTGTTSWMVPHPPSKGRNIKK